MDVRPGQTLLATVSWAVSAPHSARHPDIEYAAKLLRGEEWTEKPWAAVDADSGESG